MNAPRDVAKNFLDYHVPTHETYPAAMPSLAVLLLSVWEKAQNATIRQAAVQYTDGQVTCHIGPTTFDFPLGPVFPTETLTTEDKE